MKRIYLSGPISGFSKYHDKFKACKDALVAAGYNNIVNPAELDAVINKASYEEYMGLCIGLIDMCDVIVLLPGWEKSVGANREYGYALGKDKLIFTFEELMEVEHGTHA